jgi:hypothetical protein
MFGVLLLWLVLVMVECFNGRPAASISFNGRVCVFLQAFADLRYSESSGLQGRNVGSVQ